jgi:hypothetical protein
MDDTNEPAMLDEATLATLDQAARDALTEEDRAFDEHSDGIVDAARG